MEMFSYEIGDAAKSYPEEGEFSGFNLTEFFRAKSMDTSKKQHEPGAFGFADPTRVDYLPDWQQAADRIAAIAREGDIVMTLSCGDVYRIIPQVLEALGR